MSAEPVEQHKLLFWMGGGHDQRNKSLAGLRGKIFGREQLHVAVAEYRRIEGRIPATAGCGGSRPLRPHPRLADQAWPPRVIGVEDESQRQESQGQSRDSKRQKPRKAQPGAPGGCLAAEPLRTGNR